ncbi:MAG: hypothetical protein ACI9UA_005953, partial [Pseudoalteromonas tetraodonis]
LATKGNLGPMKVPTIAKNITVAEKTDGLPPQK